eukprot:7995025-Ditylum_brightwellii.AAC.1
MRPVGIGEALQHLAGKAILFVCGDVVTEACGATIVTNVPHHGHAIEHFVSTGSRDVGAGKLYSDNGGRHQTSDGSTLLVFGAVPHSAGTPADLFPDTELATRPVLYVHSDGQVSNTPMPLLSPGLGAYYMYQ